MMDRIGLSADVIDQLGIAFRGAPGNALVRPIRLERGRAENPPGQANPADERHHVLRHRQQVGVDQRLCKRIRARERDAAPAAWIQTHRTDRIAMAQRKRETR